MSNWTRADLGCKVRRRLLHKRGSFIRLSYFQFGFHFPTIADWYLTIKIPRTLLFIVEYDCTEFATSLIRFLQVHSEEFPAICKNKKATPFCKNKKSTTAQLWALIFRKSILSFTSLNSCSLHWDYKKIIKCLLSVMKI